MGARLGTALLMLAAVFGVHGLQCTSAADGAGHAGTPAGHALSLGSTPALGTPPVVPGHAHALATSGMASADPAAVLAPGRADSEPAPPALVAAAAAGHGDGAHDSPTHLWTVCLAILAATVSVLLAFLVRRGGRLTAPVLVHVRARLRSVARGRPPDLSALCLLRI